MVGVDRQPGPLATAIFAHAIDYRANEAEWLEFVDEHLDELAAIIAYDAGFEPEQMLHIGAVLWRYWMIRGNWAEGLGFVRPALAASTGLESKARVRVLYGAAILATYEGNIGQSEPFEREGLELAERLNDQRGIGDALNIKAGSHSNAAADPGPLLAMLNRSLAAYREIGDEVGMAEAHINLGEVHRIHQHWSEALTHNLAVLEAGTKLDNLMLMANALGNTAYLYRASGDLDTATSYYIESLRAVKQLAFPIWMGYGLVSAGGMLVALKRFAEAARVMSAGIAAFPEHDTNLDVNDANQLDEDIARIKSAIGIGWFELEWLAGVELGPIEAIDLAIALLSE